MLNRDVLRVVMTIEGDRERTRNWQVGVQGPEPWLRGHVKEDVLEYGPGLSEMRAGSGQPGACYLPVAGNAALVTASMSDLAVVCS